MMIIEKIVYSLSMKIEIEMDRNQFTFASKKGSFSINTCVFLGKDKELFKVLSIGTAPPDSIVHKKVELFSSNSKGDHECLKRFIEHGLSLTTNKRALIRPSIKCKGLNNFSEFFHGYEHGIFFNLFMDAGALDVEFI